MSPPLITRRTSRDRLLAGQFVADRRIGLGEKLGYEYGLRSLDDIATTGGDRRRARLQAYNRGEQIYTPAQLKERFEEEDLVFDRPMPLAEAEVLRSAHLKERMREELIARGPQGAWTLPFSIAAGLARAATDPYELPTMFIPIVGPGTRAAMAARVGVRAARVAEGAIEGAVGTALIEPIYAYDRVGLGLSYGWEDAAFNIGVGGAFGAGIGGVRAAFAGPSRRQRRAKALIDEANRALDEGRVGDIDFTQVKPSDFERLTPGQRQTLAHRIAVAQAAAGLDIDVRGLADVSDVARHAPEIRAARRQMVEEAVAAGAKARDAEHFADLVTSMHFSMLQRHGWTLADTRELFGQFGRVVGQSEPDAIAYALRQGKDVEVVVDGKRVRLRQVFDERGEAGVRETLGLAGPDETRRAFAEALTGVRIDAENAPPRSTLEELSARIRQLMLQLDEAEDSAAAATARKRLGKGEAVGDDGVRVVKVSPRKWAVETSAGPAAEFKTKKEAVAAGYRMLRGAGAEDIAAPAAGGQAAARFKGLSAEEGEALVAALARVRRADLAEIVAEVLEGRAKGDTAFATEWNTRLEEALGDAEAFPRLVAELQKDPRYSVAAAKALAKKFTGSAGKSGKASLDLIKGRHNSLIGLRARIDAVGGRSAGQIDAPTRTEALRQLAAREADAPLSQAERTTLRATLEQLSDADLRRLVKRGADEAVTPDARATVVDALRRRGELSPDDAAAVREILARMPDRMVREIVEEAIGARTRSAGEALGAAAGRRVRRSPTQIDGGTRTARGDAEAIIGGAETRGLFDSADGLIRLFQHQNPTTLKHELGHAFLHLFLRAAETEKATPSMRADAAELRGWLGVESYDQFRGPSGRTADEKFAESFELYLASGKAPSTVLARIFEDFRRWVIQTFQTVAGFKARRRHAEPFPEAVRQVVDRMIAPDEVFDLRKALGDILDPDAARARDGGRSVADEVDALHDAARQEGQAAARQQPRPARNGKPRVRPKAAKDQGAAPEAAERSRPVSEQRAEAEEWSARDEAELRRELGDGAARAEPIADEALSEAPRTSPRLDPDEIETAVSMWRFVETTLRGAKRYRPEGLTSWLVRTGGIVDDGGDVRSMGGGAKERPGLIRSGGRSLDDAAQEAWEAGYFAEGRRPTVNDLLEAIGDDLAGRQRLTVAGERALDDIAVARQMADELEEAFGVSPRQFRSEAALRKHLGQRDIARSGGEGAGDAAPDGRAPEAKAANGEAGLGEPRLQLDDTEPAAPGPLEGFFSAAARAVEEAKQEKNSPSGWSAWLKKQPGVTKEELDVIGWDAWVASIDAKSLTKGDVAAFIRANQPDVEIRQLKGDDAAFPKKVIRGGTNYREVLVRAPKLKPWESWHFADQEVVHIRGDDRVGENGEKIFFVQEIQSDIHQVARERGYVNSEFDKKLRSAIAEIEPLQAKLSSADATSHERITQEINEIAQKAGYQDAAALRRASADLVPDAPFKGEHWTQIAVKVALRIAAQEGYDAVAFPRADQILPAEGQRTPDLSVHYNTRIPSFLKKYVKKIGGTVGRSDVGPPEVVKDVGDLLTRLAPEERARLDAHIAENNLFPAEEMRTSIVATMLRELGIAPKSRGEIAVRITPEMRERLAGPATDGRGQPLFQLGEPEPAARPAEPAAPKRLSELMRESQQYEPEAVAFVARAEEIDAQAQRIEDAADIIEAEAAAGRSSDAELRAALKDSGLDAEDVDTLVGAARAAFDDGGRLQLAQTLNSFVDQTWTAAAIKRREAIRNARILRQILAETALTLREKRDLVLGLEARITGVNSVIDGGRLSADGVGSARGAALQGQLVQDLMKAGLWDRFRRGDLDQDFVRELHAVQHGRASSTGNAAARQLAEIVDRHLEAARKWANVKGADIGRYKGRVLRNDHDVRKIERRGFAAWRAFVIDRLDWQRIGIHPQDTARVDRFLQESHATIITGRPNRPRTPDDVAQAFVGPRNVARALSEHRVLHWKDADAWLEYNREYGGAGIIDLVMGDIEGTMRAAGLMDRMGTNPEAMLALVRSKIEQRHRLDPNAAELTRQINAKWIDNRVKEVTGATRTPPPGAQVAADLGSGWRAIMSSMRLGGAVLSALGDIGFLIGENLVQGVGPLRAIYNGATGVFRGIALSHGWGQAQLREFTDLVGVGLSGTLGQMTNRLEVGENYSRTAGKLLTKFFKVTLLTQWTDSVKRGATIMFASHLHRVGPDLFGPGGNRQTAALTRLYGFDGASWREAHSLAATTIAGRDLLDPRRIFEAAERATTEAERLRLTELGGKLQTMLYDRSNFASPTPGAGERAILNRGTSRGTVEGEALRFVTQFKSFGATVINKNLGSLVHTRADATGRGTGVANHMRGMANMGVMRDAAMVIGTAWTLGMVAMAAKDMAKGREPREIGYDSAMAALLQSGGLGIYGDFLLGRTSRFGASLIETVAGPTAGFVAELDKLRAGLMYPEDLGDDMGAGEVLNFIRHNTPGLSTVANMFYTKTLFDYAIFYQLQEMANPGYLRRRDKGLERNNSQKAGISFLGIKAPSQAIPRGGGSRIFEGMR